MIIAGAWEEHAVNIVTVRTPDEEVLAIECLLQDVTCLIDSREYGLVLVAAATFLLAAGDAVSETGQYIL